ncbi:DUF2391 family protein [Halosimplex aquaticum]
MAATRRDRRRLARHRVPRPLRTGVPGQARRTVDHEQAVLLHAGQVCLVYAVGLAVSVVLLWGFGYLSFTPATDVQKVVVLSFPTTVGGAAARVIL